MIKGDGWISVPQAARKMGMSRQGSLKYLKRLNRRYDGRLLDRVDENAPWLVCIAVLTEIVERRVAAEPERKDDLELSQLALDVHQLKLRQEELRNSHSAFRRVTNKRLSKHDKLLETIRNSNIAVERILAED
jgi:molybdenum-dependent DNA-binding transcriptional regulator ModE